MVVNLRNNNKDYTVITFSSTSALVAQLNTRQIKRNLLTISTVQSDSDGCQQKHVRPKFTSLFFSSIQRKFSLVTLFSIIQMNNSNFSPAD